MMKLFWGHRRYLDNEKKYDKKSYSDVVDITKGTHKKAAEAKKATDKLNKLLENNGITLKIHIAAGGRHGH